MTDTGAGFVKAEKDSKGNYHPQGSNRASSGSVTEELSEGDIRKKRILGEKNNLVVSELSEGGTVRERKEGERYIKIPVDKLDQQDRLEKWGFEEEELSAMREGKHLIEGTEPVDNDKTWREALKEEVEAHNDSVREKKAKEEIEKLKDFTKEQKYRKEVNELTGEEFGEIISENVNGSGETQEEELSEAIDEIKEKYGLKDEPNTVEGPTEIEEMAASDWSEYGGVFAEFAKDISDSDEETEFLSISENSRRVRTSDSELRGAILNHEEEDFSGKVEIHEYDRSTGTVEATISEN